MKPQMPEELLEKLENNYFCQLINNPNLPTEKIAIAVPSPSSGSGVVYGLSVTKLREILHKYNLDVKPKDYILYTEESNDKPTGYYIAFISALN